VRTGDGDDDDDDNDDVRNTCPNNSCLKFAARCPDETNTNDNNTMYIFTIDSPESLKKKRFSFYFYSPNLIRRVISAPHVFRLAVNRVITLVGRPFKIQHRSGSRLLLSIHGFDMIHRDRAAAASSPARRRIISGIYWRGLPSYYLRVGTYIPLYIIYKYCIYIDVNSYIYTHT